MQSERSGKKGGTGCIVILDRLTSSEVKGRFSLHPRIYDTLTRRLQPLFEEGMDQGGTFRMYCCGPTVYGPAHIGNFRTFLLQDVLRRLVEMTGRRVKHVRNVTDVDDKTIQQSQAVGKRLCDFTEIWRERFQDDCASLGLLAPTDEPGAVAHIPDQITLIQHLLKKGYAYERGGSVYFRVGSFPEYGKLSRVEARELLSENRLSQDSDEYDREAASDFVLWKARKPEDGENFWDSPWGEGRPGWHIECSAMSVKYLGTAFDLHSGGADLIFPHHENEIAQSEAATGEIFARLWMHVEHLTVAGSKMSKSLGNLYTLQDGVERGFRPVELRYALVAGHYRKPLNFTWDSVAAAASALARLQRFLTRVMEREQLLASPSENSTAEGVSDFGPFTPAWEALCDDLNTPEALGRVFGIIPTLSGRLDMMEKEELGTARRGLMGVMRVLGIEPETTSNGERPNILPPDISQLAEERWQARLKKDWALSDRLRDELADRGWVVKDGKEGYEVLPRNAHEKGL